MIDDLRDLAVSWLSLAASRGWGVEGPDGAQATVDLVQQLARLETTEPVSADGLARIVRERAVGSRPVDALFEAADLLAQATTAPPARRAELLSAARGWLRIADGPR